MESINFDCVAGCYNATRGGEERGVRLASDIAPLLRRECPVLEIGVGTGIIARPLRDLGFSMFGLDISTKMLIKARERLGPLVVNADAADLPIATDSFDQALSVWVLHLVGDVGRVLTEVARVLRSGGRYLVMDGRPRDDDPDPFQSVWRELDEAVGRPPRLRSVDRVQEWVKYVPAAALHVVDLVPTGPYPIATSAANVATAIETRAHSWMWSISDDVWNRVAPPIVARLRAQPNADEKVTFRGYQQILVLER